MALALRWVFWVDIRTGSDFCFIQHKLIGFYNRGRKCLLRGTNLFLIYSRLRFVFKRLNYTCIGCSKQCNNKYSSEGYIEWRTEAWCLMANWKGTVRNPSWAISSYSTNTPLNGQRERTREIIRYLAVGLDRIWTRYLDSTGYSTTKTKP